MFDVVRARKMLGAAAKMKRCVRRSGSRSGTRAVHEQCTLLVFADTADCKPLRESELVAVVVLGVERRFGSARMKQRTCLLGVSARATLSHLDWKRARSLASNSASSSRSLSSRSIARLARLVDMAAQTNTGRRAYVTLLTNARYLPGLVRLSRLLRSHTLDPTHLNTPVQLLLDHTMKQVNTRYPLVVLTTPSFPSEHLDLLETLGMETRRIELLEPQGEVTLIAERFKDTWSKLQAFALEDYDVRPSYSLSSFSS